MLIRYVPNITSFGFDWTKVSGYEKFVSFAKYAAHAAPRVMSLESFASALKGKLSTIVYDLNVYTFNVSEACDQIAEIARVHAANGGSDVEVMLELGNELYSTGQVRRAVRVCVCVCVCLFVCV
jgi:hypothetical protein